MKLIEFEPKICKGSKALYQGCLVIKLPHALQRAEYVKTINTKLPDQADSDNSEIDAITNHNAVEMLPDLIKIAQDLIHDSKIVNKKSKEAISKDDLFYDSDMMEVLTEVGTAALSGFKPAKN